MIAANAIVREPEHHDGAPDVDDTHVWSLVENNPNYVLVTGDKLLLEHRSPKSRVVTPRQFVDLLAR